VTDRRRYRDEWMGPCDTLPVLWFYVFPWVSLHLPIDSSGFTG
jgi:hypothetical protein